MLDHPSCFSDSVLNADTSVHEYEGNTWGPNGVDKIDSPAGNPKWTCSYEDSSPCRCQSGHVSRPQAALRLGP